LCYTELAHVALPLQCLVQVADEMDSFGDLGAHEFGKELYPSGVSRECGKHETAIYPEHLCHQLHVSRLLALYAISAGQRQSHWSEQAIRRKPSPCACMYGVQNWHLEPHPTGDTI
jgi:hypothetical protein